MGEGVFTSHSVVNQPVFPSFTETKSLSIVVPSVDFARRCFAAG